MCALEFQLMCVLEFQLMCALGVTAHLTFLQLEPVWPPASNCAARYCARIKYFKIMNNFVIGLIKVTTPNFRLQRYCFYTSWKGKYVGNILSTEIL